MKTFVYQTQEKGCGFATVKMALIHCSGESRYAYIPEPYAPVAPDLGTLLSYARDHGLILRALKTPEPREVLAAAEFPVILVLREEGPLHLVFLTRRLGKRFRVLDPKRGPLWMKGERLAEAFTGIYLKIESYEEGGESRLSHLGAPIPAMGLLALGGLALLPMAFMLLGLAFLDFSFPPWLVLGAFLATIACSGLQRHATLMAMRRFDKRYLCGIDEPLLRQRKQLYVHYHAFKRAAFVSRGEVLGRFAAVAAALAIFLLHDVYLASSGGIGLVFLSFLHLFLDPSLRRLGHEAEEVEERYLQGSLGEAARQDALAALSSRAERYGRLLQAREGALLLLGMGLAFFACWCSSSFALQPFLFALISMEFLLSEGEKAFEIEPLLSQRKREETYFRVHILPRVMERQAQR